MSTLLLLDEIIQTLKAADLKPSGSGVKWTAFCPLHGDTNNRSLTIGIGNKDNILINCLAQCSTYQQRQAWFTARGVKFPKKEQAPDSDNMVWKDFHIAPYGRFAFKWDVDKAEPVLEKLYVYRRKNGEAYAFKMRLNPKDFRRHKIDGDKIKSNWSGIDMDPYNWDKACEAAAAGRVIIVVEGEKDSDNICENLGYVAISAGGVSDKWEERWNADLKGAKGIIVIADNDLVKGNTKEPGLVKANTLCQQLKEAGFPVKLLMFEKHKDSSDWIKAGGDRAQFNEEIKKAKVWDYPPHKKPTPPEAPIVEAPAPQRSPMNDLAVAAAVIEVKTNPNKKDWSKYPFAPCTDSANAVRLAANNGDVIRYIPEKKKWYVFNGKHWEADDADAVQEYCKQVSQRIFAEEIPVADFSIRNELDKWASQCQDMSRIRAIKAAAQSMPGLVARIEDFDTRDTHQLLNCKNGTLNFKTGILEDHNAKHLITHLAPHNYVPEMPENWMKHIDRCFGGDMEMIQFWHMYFGYCFTGETYFQRYAYIKGMEGTGKSFTHQTIELVLGSYFGTIDPQSLCEVDQRSAGAESDLESTRGKRLILAAEMKSSQKLDEQIVKALTGGDTIKTKGMGENKRDLKGCAKLWFTGNEFARITPTGAMQRRLMTIPFNQQLPPSKWIEDYHQVVAQEDGGRLIHLAMMGAQAATLKVLAQLPNLVAGGNKEYLEEVNLALQWKHERVKRLSGMEITGTNAYADFQDYFKRQGMRPWTKPTFQKALRESGMVLERNHMTQMVYKDFTLA